MASPPPPEHLGPYLRLSHRLSLAPFAYPIIAVGFLAFRFYVLYKSSNSLVQDAKDFVLSACLGAQHAATIAVSIPRWMAIEINQEIVRVATGMLDAAREGLNLCLTGLEKMIIFLISAFAGFFGCILQLLVQGGLAVIITVVQFVENGLNALGGDITQAVSGAQNAVNSAVGGINTALSWAGFGTPIPTMNVPISSLNIQVPDTLSQSLESLSNSIPTLDQLISELDDLISRPFTSLQSDINNTFTQLAADTFQADALPVPDVRNIDFCDNIDLSVIDEVGSKITWIIRWIAISLAVLLVLMIVASLIKEWYSWFALQEAVTSVSDSWADPHAPEGTDPIPVVALDRNNILILQSQLQHGFRTKILAKIRSMFNWKRQTTSQLSWFLTYVTYPSALMFLMIGVIGLIVVGIQYALIAPLEKEFNNLENLVLGNYTAEIIAEITHAINVDTLTYANDVNGWIDDAQNGINNDVFGFTSSAADTINSTVVRFYDDMQDGIRSAFGNTLFGNAVSDFALCLVGNKVLALEQGIAWLKAHMHMSLPHIDPTFLQISTANIQEMATFTNAAASTQDTSGSDESGIGADIIAAYKDILKAEAILFGVCLGIWGLVVLEACIILGWHKASAALKARREAATAAKENSSRENEMNEKVMNNA